MQSFRIRHPSFRFDEMPGRVDAQVEPWRETSKEVWTADAHYRRMHGCKDDVVAVVRLDVDVQDDARIGRLEEKGEEVIKERNRRVRRSAKVEALDAIRVGPIAYSTLCCYGMTEAGIVMEDEDAVFEHAHVDLDRVASAFEGSFVAS